MKETLILFGTAACHLCELAQDILHATLNPQFFDIQWVDIAESEALIEQYGVKIPVLKRQVDGSELQWPFGADDLMGFLDDG